MKYFEYLYNILIYNVLGGGKTFLKGIFVNKSLLLSLSVFLLSSCGNAEKDDVLPLNGERGDSIVVTADDSWKDTIEVDYGKQDRVICGPDRGQ